MNVRKVLAGSMAAITAGATLAFGVFGAGLGDYVVAGTNKITSPIIVIGDPAQPSADFAKDVLGAADIAAAVAGYATTKVSAGGSITTAVSGAADLATGNTQLYFGSTVNSAKSTLTSQDNGLGTVLEGGGVYDDLGTEHKYNQYIALNNTAIMYGDAGGDIAEPTIYLNVGTDSANPIYTTRVVFSRALNISSNDVKSQAITLFGNEYTIGSESTATTLYLYGGAQKNTVSEGETATITVSGTEHIVKIIGVSSTTVAVIEVDGVSKEVTEGTSYTINGDKGKIDVFIDAVYFFGKESQVSSVRLSLGAAKIKLENGAPISTGTESTNIDGTFVRLTGDPLSKLEIDVAMQETDADYVIEGMPFTDPVFGTFKTAIGGIAPAIDSSARTVTTFKTAGDDKANIKYTDYRGNEKEFTFAYNNGTSPAMVPILGESSTKKIVVVEGQTVNRNDYVVLAQGDFSHLYQLTTVSSIGQSTGYVELTDVFDSSKVTVSMTSPGYTNASAYIDGQEYFVDALASGSTSAKFTWGTTAAASNPGNETTLFPMIGGKNGEGLALIWNVTVGDTYYFVPGGSSGYSVFHGNTTTWNAGQVTYTFNGGVLTAVNTASLGDSFPIALLLEEKGKDTSNAEKRNAVIVESSTDGASSPKVEIATTVVMTDATAPSPASSTADSDISTTVDRYGTHVTIDSDGQNNVEVSYPDEQATVAVAIGPTPSFTSAGGAVEVDSAVKITAPVAKLASEVQAMINANTLNADVILVGGPCANSLVATLAADGHVKTCDAWDYTTGVIKEVADAFVTGKNALIVAGTMADDTRSLAAKVMQNTLSFSA